MQQQDDKKKKTLLDVLSDYDYTETQSDCIETVK